MTAAGGARLRWDELPAAVRAGVEDLLGGRVVEHVSQPGGFSPGSADRVVLAEGRRAFVKAVGSTPNPDSPTLHRREAAAAPSLPARHVPALLGTYDDGDWVALAFVDVAGRHPATPWRADELDAVLATLRELRAHAPSSLPSVATASALSGDDWGMLAAGPPADLDPWARARLAELRALADHGRAAARAGQSLLHADLRADNLLVRADGTIAVLDWPWACVGAWWFDVVLLAAHVACAGGPDPELLLARECAGVDADALTGTLAGFLGLLLERARRPAPPGLPLLRAFQRAQADALLPWLRSRVTGR